VVGTGVVDIGGAAMLPSPVCTATRLAHPPTASADVAIASMTVKFRAAPCHMPASPRRHPVRDATSTRAACWRFPVR
jgi:hypothetical protein